MHSMYFAHIKSPITFHCSYCPFVAVFSKLFPFRFYVFDSGDSQLNRGHLGDKPPPYQRDIILVQLIGKGRPTLE